jgi:hypothetical protein
MFFLQALYQPINFVGFIEFEVIGARLQPHSCSAREKPSGTRRRRGKLRANHPAKRHPRSKANRKSSAYVRDFG